MPVSELNRRELLRLLAFASAAAATAPTSLRAAEATPAAPASVHRHQPQLRMGSEKIVILVYPEFTALDALGPHYPLSGMMGATVRFVAKNLAPVPCEGAAQGGFCVRPHHTFADCPADFDRDGEVGTSDLSILLATWGTATTLPGVDIVTDGIIDSADLSVLLQSWGPCSRK